jgi:hypothetical protein
MESTLVVTASSALAQENRGTEQQRVACTPDVLRLYSWEIPNVDRIVACLRREKPQLIPFPHHIERTIYGKDVMDLTIFGLRSM